MSNEVFVTVRINDKCGPIDRGEFYEDPLQEALDEKKLGEGGQRNCHTSSNEESIVYYGGASFEVMKEKISEYVASHPRYEKGKITQAA